MKKEVVMFLLLILNFLLILNLVSATLSIGNQSYFIEKKYGPSQNIIGWINVSVSNEDENSTFNDSLGNNITLLELLKQNPNVKYSCSPKDCKSDYSASSGDTQKGLSGVGTKFYGMLFSGEIFSVNSVSFDLSSSGGAIPPSCSSQIEIDFFDDEIVDFSNTNIDSDVCSETKSYGCFDTAIPYELTTIETQPNCQKINLSKAPGFRIGAWIKKEGTGTKDINAIIYDKNGGWVDEGSCKLPDASTSGGEVYCDVSYSVKKPGEHYVCISAGPGVGTYKIKAYSTTNGCGFWNYPPANENAAYSIFVIAKKFGSFNSINVLDLLNTGDTLSYMTENYIRNRYGNLNCTNNCVVPVKFVTNLGTTENLKIGNIKIDHDKSLGNVVNDKLYDVLSSPAKINSDFGKLYLDNSGLKVKSSLGSFNYALKFNTQTLFSEMLSVEKTPIIKGLTPLKTAYAFPTKFWLYVDKPGNVSYYQWNFGDNTTDTTTTNKVTHIYDDAGDYNLKVIIKDFNNINSSRTFSINVTSPKFLINTTIEKMKKDLANVKTQINNFDLFDRAGLGAVIKTNELDTNLTRLEQKYKISNESDYNEIVSEILELKIPESVMISINVPNYVFFPDRTSINVDVLKDIEGGNTENNGSYEDSIYLWNSENIINTLNYKKISARYDENSEPLLKVFSFKIEEKTQLDYSPYFIVKNLENLRFKEDYGQKTINGYTYIELISGKNEITFSTTEDVSFDDVPAFVSPSLSKLSVINIPNEPTEPEEKPFKWDIFFISILILLIIGIIIYIFLQIWYKNKYEQHLFKNKNDLYNLFHFIEAQRRKGVSEKEIHSKLKGAGWNSEQIKYSMKKYSGKRTGMLEIPIDKLFQKFEKKNDTQYYHKNM